MNVTDVFVRSNIKHIKLVSLEMVVGCLKYICTAGEYSHSNTLIPIIYSKFLPFDF